MRQHFQRAKTSLELKLNSQSESLAMSTEENNDQLKDFFKALPDETLKELILSLDDEKLKKLLGTLPVDRKTKMMKSFLGESGLSVTYGNTYSFCATGDLIHVEGSASLGDLLREGADLIAKKAAEEAVTLAAEQTRLQIDNFKEEMQRFLLKANQFKTNNLSHPEFNHSDQPEEAPKDQN